MAQEKLLEALKKDVRSLLVSAKGGLALEQLKRDYLKMLGHPLPLMALGYRNVLDMVRDMPDVVALSCSEDGTTLLKAISNDSTKGIEQLVAKQRNPKPKESTRRVGVWPGYHRRAQQAQALPRRGQAPPAIPAQLRSQLRQLLSQGPVMLSELEACFFKRFGRPLQVMQYGFYSFAEMLAAASDFVAIEQGRKGSLISLKSDNGSLNYAQKWTSTGLQQGLTVKPPQDSVAKDKSRLLSNWASGPVLLNKGGPSVSPGDEKPHTEGPHLQPELDQKERALENCIEKLEEQLKSQILECGAGAAVRPELKEKLRQVVAQRSDGISIHELPGEFKKMFGEDLPMARCGFLSVTEMVEALSDTLYLKPRYGKEGNHWIIQDIQHRHNSSGREEVKGTNAAEFVEDLKLSKSNYSCCGESPWEEKYGDRRLSSEVMEDETTFKVVKKSFHQMVDIFPVTPLPPNGGGTVPLDAMRDQKLHPAPRWQERALVAVLVERVESPNHFYIRFDGTPENRALENMMIEMRTCYTCPEVSERYRLPQSFVRPGQVCCLALRDVWFYRVIIHRVLNDSQVEVYYVDYGDLNTVDWRKLKLLKSCYSELPVQAVLSSLIGVQPVGVRAADVTEFRVSSYDSGSWSKSSISYFQKLCCEHPLVAIIHSYQKDILHVFLCDTQTEEDVYIHTALMTEGHAFQCPASDSQHISIQFNPVTLYLATGPCDVGHGWDSPGGPRTNEGAWSGPGTQRETRTVRAEDDITDLPDLEVIDIPEVTRTAQANLANPFGALLCKESVYCEDPEQGSTAGGNARDAEPKTEANHNKNHGDRALLDTAGRDASAPELLGVGCVGQAPTDSPPPTPASPPPTPLAAGGSEQAGDHGGVAPSQAVPEKAQSFMLSLFAPGGGVRSPRPCLRHVPPSFLGPAARLAAGTPFLNWHCHKAS